MDTKDRIIEEQRQLIAELRLEIEALKLALARATKDSSNSSKSPSSDITKPPKKNAGGKGARKKRKRGGQPGRQRKLRQPLPPDRVDEAFVHELTDAEVSRQGLTPLDQFQIVQHIELLDLPIHVTEHRLRKYLTRDGQTVVTQPPELEGQPIFGPRLLAMIGWLKSRAHCSYTTIETWMDEVLQVPVSRGYLAKLCNGTISESVAPAYDQLRATIPEQPTLGSDETCVKNHGQKQWAWCITAPHFTLFHLAASRGRTVLEELIGGDYDGILHLDYFSSNCSFAWNFDIQAQYCWAHLIRDIRFLEKHPDNRVRVWADRLLDRTKRMFSAWHRREAMSKEGQCRSFVMHRDKFLAIVRKPPDASDAKNISARFAEVELEEGGRYDMSQDYFRFLFASGVEPTNNHTEQQVRHCVIDRRITQGTRSAVGQRYHERMWTTIATCNKQGRSFFAFLHQAIEANLSGSTPLSLLGG